MNTSLKTLLVLSLLTLMVVASVGLGAVPYEFKRYVRWKADLAEDDANTYTDAVIAGGPSFTLGADFEDTVKMISPDGDTMWVYWDTLGDTLRYVSTSIGKNDSLLIRAVHSLMRALSGSIERSANQWADLSQSAGVAWGCEITSVTDSTFAIDSGFGIIRCDTIDTCLLFWFDIDDTTDFKPALNTTYYAFIDYNSGDPVFDTTSNLATINFDTELLLGRFHRDDEHIHIANGGIRITDLNTKTTRYNFEGDFARRTSGLLTSEGDSTLSVAITAGVAWSGLTRFTFDAIETSLEADTLHYWYLLNGTWVDTHAFQIDSLQYNDISTPGSEGLATLTANRYGVHWVNIEVDGEVNVLYGQGDYKVTEAIEAQYPSSIPPFFSTMTIPIAKIIVRKDNDAFTEVIIPFAVPFVSSTVSNHNDLSGLQGGTAGQYYHLTLPELTKLQDSIPNGDSLLALIDTLQAQLDTTDLGGRITFWWGDSADIPAGWSVCNGDTHVSGTDTLIEPDMVGRYIVSAGGIGDYSPLDTVGVDSSDFAHIHEIDSVTAEAAHKHLYEDSALVIRWAGAGTAVVVPEMGTVPDSTSAGTSHKHDTPDTDSQLGYIDNRPRSIALWPIMRIRF